METLLPEATEEAGQVGQAVHSTDGIAGALATEFHADTGAGGNAESATEPGRRPGRPPIHGRYSQSAGSDGKHPVPLAGAEEIPPAQVETDGGNRVSIPPEVLSKVFHRALTFAERWGQHKIEGVGALAGLSQGEIMPQLKQAQISPEDKTLAGELLPLVLEEWGIDIRLSPTLALGAVLGPPALAAASAYLTLAKLAKERQAHPKAPKGAPTIT